MANKKANRLKTTIETIPGNGILVLSERDMEVVCNAILFPKGPNEKLRDAAEKYKSFILKNNS